MPELLDLAMVWNHGVTFGLLPGQHRELEQTFAHFATKLAIGVIGTCDLDCLIPVLGGHERLQRSEHVARARLMQLPELVVQPAHALRVTFRRDLLQKQLSELVEA